MSAGRAQELQDRYLKGDSEALGPLYLEIKTMARKWVSTLGKAMNTPTGEVYTDLVAHDAATNIISLYMRKPGYKVRSFPARVRLDVLHVMTGGMQNDRPITKLRRGTICLDLVEGAAEEPEEECDPFDAIRSHAKGYQIVADIATTYSFRDALVKITGYVQRRWILDNVSHLFQAHEMTWQRKSRSS